jgi:PAS domain S-box-containing protein
MAALVAGFDGAATALGPRSGWSASLALAFDVIQAAAFPMALRWGPRFVLLYNEAYRPILGDKHPWAFGRPASEAWSEVWPEIAPIHEAILNGESPAVFSEDQLFRIRRRQGELEEARFSLGYSPVPDPTAPSGIGGVLVTAIETTRRVAAEAALRASEERYELALSASGVVGTWDWDPKADRLIANPLLARLFSIDPDLARGGAPIDAFIAGIHPDDRATVVADITQRMRAGEEFALEFRLVSADGSVSWVASRGRGHYGPDGEATRMIGAAVDITDRKRAAAALERSEAEFRTLAEAMPNLLWAARADGTLNWFNEQAYAYAGADGRQGGWLSLVHPDDMAPTQARWARSVATGETYQTEFRLRRADGAWRWHLARALPIRDSDGRIMRWIGSNTDIDDQKTMAEALATLNATLEEQVSQRTGELLAAEAALRQSQKMEAVGQLTGGIAHDFNNMLAVICGSLELLERQLGDSDPKARRLAEAASEGARKAALLTQRLLAFSRRQPLSPEAVDVNGLILGMSDLLRHSIGPATTLRTRLDPSLWRVHADPNQLENAILNLGLNARDAMPEGGLLTLATRNLPADDDGSEGPGGAPRVLIAVSDTGVGMSPEVVERAFEPFFTTKEVGKGTGLGLSQVYGFIKQSGGRMRIVSAPGEGATIEIRLPKLEAGPRDEPAARPPAATAETDVRALILVVEDEAAVRQVTVEAVRALGYEALEADGPETALRLIEAHPAIALLFTDVIMPGMDGPRLAATARRLRPDLKVLFATGYRGGALGEDGEAGGADVIAKPFTLETLATKLRGILAVPV